MIHGCKLERECADMFSLYGPLFRVGLFGGRSCRKNCLSSVVNTSVVGKFLVGGDSGLCQRCCSQVEDWRLVRVLSS